MQSTNSSNCTMIYREMIANNEIMNVDIDKTDNLPWLFDYEQKRKRAKRKTVKSSK